MRPTAVASCIVAAIGMLLSAATGATAETRLGDIKLPPGFRIAPYAEVPNARSMTLGEKGTLFVGTRKGEVYAVLPGDTAEGTHRVVTIARNLHSPNGVAFRGGRALRRRDRPDPAVRRDRIAPVLPPRPGRRQRKLPEGRTPRLEVHPLRSRRDAVRPGGGSVQRLRTGRPALCRDPADASRRNRAGGLRVGGAEHRRVRLEPGHRGTLVHRQRPRLDGGRSPSGRVEPCAAERAPFRFSLRAREESSRSGIRRQGEAGRVHAPGVGVARPRRFPRHAVLHGEDVPSRISGPGIHRRARLVEPLEADRVPRLPRPPRREPRREL